MPATVWVDDRSHIFRRGLASCLGGAGFRIAGESAGFAPQPDLRGVDVLLFDLTGPALERAIRLRSGTAARLVGIGEIPIDEVLCDAVEAGLAGLLPRSDLTPFELINCVGTVAQGCTALPGDVMARLVRGLAAGSGPVARMPLAGRELEVLRLLALGGRTREIAEDLCYSEKTVKNIVHDLLVKMNCRTRAQVVALAARRGVI